MGVVTVAGAAPPPPRRPRGKPRRVVAVGDLHGDLDAFRTLLTAAKVLDGDSWCGGRTVLVQTGDVVDRGPDSVATYEFLADLQVRASKGHGQVVRLVGNHEVMLLEGDFSHADFPGARAMAGRVAEDILAGRVRAAWAHGGWLFTHAGVVHSQILRLRGEMRAATERPRRFSIRRLAEHLDGKLHAAVQAGTYTDPIFDVGTSRGGDERDGGIFWADFDDELETPRRAPRIHQVFGHTPEGYHGARFRASGDGRRINIDIGITDDYGGNLGWLEIRGREAVAHYITAEGIETVSLGEAPRRAPSS